MRRMTLIFLLAGLVFGCTKLSVVRITNPGDSDTEGMRFYRPYPYLMISEGSVEESKPTKTGRAENPNQPAKPSKPMLQYKIIWLPDLSQEYAIRVKAGLGTIDFKPTFEEGWKLVGVDAKLDSKTKEMIEATTGLIEKTGSVLMKAVGPERKEAEEALQPGIYRFIYDMNIELNGKPNPNYGKIMGVDVKNPIATFKHQ